MAGLAWFSRDVIGGADGLVGPPVAGPGQAVDHVSGELGRQRVEGVALPVRQRVDLGRGAGLGRVPAGGAGAEGVTPRGLHREGQQHCGQPYTGEGEGRARVSAWRDMEPWF